MYYAPKGEAADAYERPATVVEMLAVTAGMLRDAATGQASRYRRLLDEFAGFDPLDRS